MRRGSWLPPASGPVGPVETDRLGGCRFGLCHEARPGARRGRSGARVHRRSPRRGSEQRGNGAVRERGSAGNHEKAKSPDRNGGIRSGRPGRAGALSARPVPVQLLRQVGGSRGDTRFTGDLRHSFSSGRATAPSPPARRTRSRAQEPSPTSGGPLPRIGVGHRRRESRVNLAVAHRSFVSPHLVDDAPRAFDPQVREDRQRPWNRQPTDGAPPLPVGHGAFVIRQHASVKVAICLT